MAASGCLALGGLWILCGGRALESSVVSLVWGQSWLIMLGGVVLSLGLGAIAIAKVAGVFPVHGLVDCLSIS